MSATEPSLDDLAADAADLAARWLRQSARQAADPDVERLRQLLREETGPAFLISLLDGVARPADLFAAGYNLQRAVAFLPPLLPSRTRLAFRLAGVLGPVLPWIVVRAVRRWLRRLFAPSLATAEEPSAAPAAAAASGSDLTLSPLGPAALGDDEADENLEALRLLLARDDVQHVTVHVPRLDARLSLWSFDETVGRLIDRLTPLFELADLNSKTITLAYDRYRDLQLILTVFRGLLDQQKFHRIQAGVMLPAYLPEGLDLLQSMTRWATERCAAGGSPITVHLVKGGNLGAERADAALRAWTVPAFEDRRAVDANFKRMLSWALTPANTGAVRIGVATQNVFDLAFAWLLAVRRQVEHAVLFEALAGIADAQTAAVQKTVGRMLVTLPVGSLPDAVPYLIGRIAEIADEEAFLHSLVDVSPQAFEREKERFFTAAADASAAVGYRLLPRRRQDHSAGSARATAGALTREREAVSPAEDTGLTEVVLGLQRGSIGAGELAGPLAGYRPDGDTDPSLAGNRVWANGILLRVPDSTAGAHALGAVAADEGTIDALIGLVVTEAARWGAESGFARADVLDRAAGALAANRDRLAEVAASEAGMTIAEADAQAGAAANLARYYAVHARQLDTVQGARFVPKRLTVVSPGWRSPVSASADGALAALAAGSGVILVPHPRAPRSSAVVAEALWEAGVPRHLLALAAVADRTAPDGPMRRSVGDHRVEQLILDGTHAEAELLLSWRPDLDLLAHTEAGNAVIVTPFADERQAVADLVAGAFAHAGQDARAAQLVVLVGAAASERFEALLADAVRSLQVGWPDDPASDVGPLSKSAAGNLLYALTTLGAGESWLVEPRKADAEGRLWTPGVRLGVEPGSYLHLARFAAPVISVMRARTLDQAIHYLEVAEITGTVALQSLDEAEIGQLLDTVEAGSVVVNRPTTGAVVGRRPAGGWKRASIGRATKSAGPNTLIPLGWWVSDESHPSRSLHLRGLDEWVTTLIESGQSAMGYPEFDLVRRSALSDAVAWATEYGAPREHSGPGFERNLLRYLPVPVVIRLAEGGSLPRLLRVLAAATLTRSPFTVSVPAELPAGIRGVLWDQGVAVSVQSDAAWLRSAAELAVHQPSVHRIRLIDGDPAALAVALGGDPDLSIYPDAVTPSGRVELLPFLREQSVSLLTHRYGIPDAAVRDLP